MIDRGFKIDKEVMDDKYGELWNSDVMKRIDADIEANRKADAAFKLADVEKGSEVKVEQLTQSFFFGSHIFNFNQLGTEERNRRYKELYGTLFNSATIPFYWKKFELEEGKPRFKGEYRDTEDFWNTVEEPYKETHWRRPATDPVVEFCESKGIRLHGHTLTWWNVVDNCGAPGEPSYSGLFTRDMEPKYSYYALNDLINNEWKTNLLVQTDSEGMVAFRGFRSKYRLSYVDKNGNECSKEFTL